MGAFGNFATEGTGFENLFPGITNTLLTLNGNFRMPLYKEYLQALGLASVSRRSCEALLCIRSNNLLTEGTTVQVVPLQLLLEEPKNPCMPDQVL